MLVTRCEAVWFVEYTWDKEVHDDGLSWQPRHCHVAPKFAAPSLPAGPLTATLDLASLEDRQGSMGLSEFMLWANCNATAPPQGFRWLSQYCDRLAVRHGLPITPLVLRPLDLQAPVLTLQDAAIIGQGHRSLVVQLTPGDDYVVKISHTANTNREHIMHAKAGGSKCQHLRTAVPGLRGVVEGAGAGLSFIGLQPFCSEPINNHHVFADSSKAMYFEQARNLVRAALLFVSGCKSPRRLQLMQHVLH